MSERSFPVLWPHEREAIAEWTRLGVPKTVPWALVADHERQAQKNHGQSLERLASRGGLSVLELVAVLDGHAGPWVHSQALGPCAQRLLNLLVAYRTAQSIPPPPPDWAIRREGDRVEYMLARFTDDPEVAEHMSVELAERHVVAFAERVQAWLAARGVGLSCSCRAYQLWRQAYAAERKRRGLDEEAEVEGFPSFESWCGERIVEHAKSKPLP